MSKQKNGGPAFPVLEYTRIASGDLAPEPTIQCGMSLRDWFAGMAMQGLMYGVEEPRGWYIAEHAYAVADEMLKERTRPTK